MRFPFLVILPVLLLSCDCADPADDSELPWIVPEVTSWQELQFGGEGSAEWTDGTLSLAAGVDLTGTTYQGKLPQIPYELELEARRVSGSDFFCGVTFPANTNGDSVTFIAGGWGGWVVGISSIDGKDAVDNETTTEGDFENGRWYPLKIVVESDRLEVSLDDEKVVDFVTTGRELSLRPGVIQHCAPLGLAAWQTEAEVRNIRWRSLAD